MPDLPAPMLERLRTVTTSFVDNAYYPEQDQRLLLWFHYCLHNEILDSGWLPVAFTFRQSEGPCLLVYKVKIDGILQVAFFSGNDPVGCIRTFYKKFHRETINWVKDKFA